MSNEINLQFKKMWKFYLMHSLNIWLIDDPLSLSKASMSWFSWLGLETYDIYINFHVKPLILFFYILHTAHNMIYCVTYSTPK